MHNQSELEKLDEGKVVSSDSERNTKPKKSKRKINLILKLT